MPRRWLGPLLLLACTPHEPPHEPQAPCPVGMALVEGSEATTPRHDRQCVDLTEVTTAAYGACVHAGACTPAVLGAGRQCNLTRRDRADHPINCVDLEQARAYCGWLGKRLPTDEEWSWFVRPPPGVAGDFPWGAAAPDAARACIDRLAHGTCPVGQHPTGAGRDGLLDLVGNVAEWTVDGESGRLRGGGWRDAPALDLPGAAAPLVSPTSGLRCVVAPFSAVAAPDLEVWTPHVVGPVELPVLAAASPRHAPVRPLANLATLQLVDQPYRPARWWPVGDAFHAADATSPDVLGLSGVLERAAFPEGLQEFVPMRRLGDDLLLMQAGLSSNLRLVAVERATHKIRWQIAFAGLGRTYEQIVAPRTLVAALYTELADALIGYGLADGRELWKLQGGEAQVFTRVRRLWTDGERGYIHGDRGLAAFDPVTGAILWSGVAVDGRCGVIAGSGALLVEDPGGHRRIDPSTGAELGPIAARPGACLWHVSSVDGGVAEAVLEDSRIFAFDPPDRRGTATLRAYDLAGGRELWRRSGLDPDVLRADHDAVYVARADELLLGLDAATGAPQVELSLAGAFDLELLAGGGPRGPLLRAAREDGTQWLLGRAEQPLAPEPYRVRGRLVPDGVSRRQVKGVPIRVGERRVRTDAAGRFEARGVARGAVAVALGNDKGPTEPGGSQVRFEPVTVVLDGRESYDVGEVNLYHWYTE